MDSPKGLLPGSICVNTVKYWYYSTLPQVTLFPLAVSMVTQGDR